MRRNMTMYQETSRQVLELIQRSPSCFHAVHQMARILEEAGYRRVKECEPWQLVKGGKYYTTRNGSSILAFHVGQQLDNYHFQIAASHSDSPSYKVKDRAELKGKGGYLQLNTEGYGGMICASWMDRPLSLAGRVLVRRGNEITAQLLNIDRDLLLIPNVAIHMNREVNAGMKFNQQVDMLPLFSAGACGEDSYHALIARELGVEPEQIVGCDLYLYPRVAPTVWGAEEEFISSPRLDDLQCAYTSLMGFLKGENPHGVNVFACFDNEEVGSGTKQGALSTFLRDTLQRVHCALGYAPEAYFQAVAKSFMVSCDNAHAVHPNHPEKTDGENCVYMNRGVVVKFSANQKYTTDGISAAIFMQLCKDAQVPVQTFANRSDMAGGSTLGNLSTQQVSLHTVDVGLPQLAMHSAYETAGVKDSAYMVQALTAFYSTDLKITDSDQFTLGE